MLTLIEAAKLHTGDVFRQAIIEMYARSSDLLQILKFDNILGNALRYNREETLPGVGFRGINEAYDESTGIINPLTEPLVIAGGDADVDKFILKTMGQDQREVQENGKIKAMALAWTKKFIKGDSTTEPREFDGLQVRLTGNQLLPAGSTANGDALSLTLLDELLDMVSSPTHIMMNKALRRRLSAAARNTSISGNIHWEKNQFGQQILYYGDLPIVIIDDDETGTQILQFNEACPGGGTSTGTSIYCISNQQDKLIGIQNGDIDARDLGELQTKPAERTRVEWYSGIACFHGKCAARMWGIKNAAVVA
ncbi:MAG: major capsid protein [Anaerohalosphaeraceae bacterium]